jgi:hypothetical protein
MVGALRVRVGVATDDVFDRDGFGPDLDPAAPETVISRPSIRHSPSF